MFRSTFLLGAVALFVSLVLSVTVLLKEFEAADEAFEVGGFVPLTSVG